MHPISSKSLSKEFDLKWTQELFKVATRFRKQGFPLYRIKDFHNDLIKGSFYTNEFQKVNKDEDVLWQVEKIIKRKRIKGKTYVHWLGWNSSFDSYVKNSALKYLW